MKSRTAKERLACREYILAMLRELAIVSSKCGEHIIAEEIMILVHNAPEPTPSGKSAGDAA